MRWLVRVGGPILGRGAALDSARVEPGDLPAAGALTPELS